MKTTHFALVLALLAPAAACGGSTSVPASTAQQAATKAPLNVQVDGPMRGPVEAFAEVPLLPAQRAEIESLVTAAHQRHQALKPAAKDVMLALADQVEAGTIDEVALKPKVDAAIAAWKPVQAEDRKTIQHVHDILDAQQRAALVDALDKKREERFAGMKEHEHPMHRLAMLGELDLTNEQKAQLFDAMRAELKDHQPGEHRGEWKERREKAELAFKSDAFDIDRDVPAFDFQSNGPMFARGVRFAKTALPILTPEQRATAAKLIRERADKMGELH